jgi:hypothetical protein
MTRMNKRLRLRFCVECVLALVTTTLFLVSLLLRDWLEAFGIEPDHHNGAAEWLTVVALLTCSVLLAGSARLEWRRTAPVT